MCITCESDFKQWVQPTTQWGFSLNHVVFHELEKICDSKRIDKNQILHWLLIKIFSRARIKFIKIFHSSTLQVAIELMIIRAKSCHNRVYAQKKVDI